MIVRSKAGVKRYLSGLVGSPLHALGTIAACWLGWKVGKFVLAWTVFDAVLFGDRKDCLAAAGACWPFILEKARFMVLGIYPPQEQWRATFALLTFIAACAVAMTPRFWNRTLLPWLLPAVLVLDFILLRGGLFGLTSVPVDRWSGLPLTVMLAGMTFAMAMPLGILLALARCSSRRPLRMLSSALIAFIRGVPLMAVLFMATVLTPLIIPARFSAQTFPVAASAITLFVAGYIAETVRSGIIAIPRAQLEAADALGLGFWQRTWLVVLPQALVATIGPLVALFIAFFQDTTLVGLVGLLDFLSTARSALRDPEWQGVATLEGYLFAAVIYAMFSLGLGAYGRYLERHFDFAGPTKGDTPPAISAI